ncbi:MULTISPECIES: hypothetical protein [Thermomonospora]|uniref:Uncharacterized protein n=1 Tax=Thermomonospora curvata (strain ATCC 19995 / DSM 43183 / JCM 3096 / KCTC 9072 / NBRC 15933 / NCIMB 10081 / Henssen B9) TaxID=471852 RepID=D1ABD8_THECD|nr:hypothetical protein Tcur_1598 [Thermomonospora curvata DSM 43183]PKK15031.1 MAG: hypothetical protein BUE48_007790 [Thermomonospora sp. CIF 1]
MNPRSRSSGDPQPPPNEIAGIFDDMLRHARELLAVRSPLDAELIVSEILGTWWGHRTPQGDADRIVGEALIGHAARARVPAALALLTGMAYLGTARQAVKAERAALDLMEHGVARPAWSDRVGMVTPEECFTSRDVYGDQDSVVCVYSYAGEDRHALVVQVDHNRSSMVRDAWVSSRVGKLLEQCRHEHRTNPLMRFVELDPRDARALLEHALDRTDAAEHPPVAESFARYHAFLRARVRALPPGGRRPTAPVYGKDRRATLAARFLASDEAEELSDRSAAGRCVDRIIEYGCEHDQGRPLRVSPVKCEMFLLDWLPRKVLLSPDEQEAMPHVLAAWVRWAGRRSGLPDEGIRATLDAVWDATGAFTEAYRDPSAFGLDRDLVRRLLPDGELDALPRRAFALPFLNGEHHIPGHGRVDLGTLNPADPGDRWIMLRFEHPDDADEHLMAHERLAVRLWHGDPPQLWETAQALLDRGFERHEILHRLIEVLERHGDDPQALRAQLDTLRHSPPPM